MTPAPDLALQLAPDWERLGLVYDRIPCGLTPAQIAQAAALVPPLPVPGSYAGRVRLKRPAALALLRAQVEAAVAAWGAVTRADLERLGWSPADLDALAPALASQLEAA